MPDYGFNPGLKEDGENEVDLMDLVLILWDKRITIVKITIAFFILGLIIAILSPVEYEASASLLPETQSSQNSASGLLRQYGGILGIGGGNIGEEGISPSLYPDIVASTPYQIELMNEPIRFSTLDTTLTPHEYFREIHRSSILDFVKKYTIGLPGQVLNLFKRKELGVVNGSKLTKENRDAVISLSSEQRSTISKLSDRLIINQDGGLVTLTAEFPDPQAAAEIGHAGINLLKQYVREYRTQKANDELNFVREQLKEAKQRFEEAQLKFAEFRDSNVNLSTAKAQTREQELRSQYDLTFDVYNNLAQNLEQAKLRVQENTPVFTTVEPFQVPTTNSKPNVKLIIFIAVFLGLVISLAYVLSEKMWSEFNQYIIKIDK